MLRPAAVSLVIALALGVGIRGRSIDAIRRSDGSLQVTYVTYAGHPRYFQGDKKRGQITCQNVSSFGGLWLVTPSGVSVC
jgi:hypothetical protein